MTSSPERNLDALNWADRCYESGRWELGWCSLSCLCEQCLTADARACSYGVMASARKLKTAGLGD